MSATGASQNYVTASQVTSTGYTMIALTSVVAFARFGARYYKQGGFQVEDFFVLFSWAAFVALAVMYIIVTPTMYKISAIEQGKTPYPTDAQGLEQLETDALFEIKIFFAGTMLLWIVLWSVKLSLLMLYRRLFEGLPAQMRWWWGALAFTFLTFVGCIVSNFTSCSSLHDWFTVGACGKESDIRAQIASLYYSYAVDIISDIIIMVLPLRLIWSLHLPLAQKLSVGAVFSVGVICIVVATVRVVSLGERSGGDNTPSSSWLAFWGMIETGIAVIIGCLPAFAMFYRKTQRSRRNYSTGYSEMPTFANAHNSGLSKTSISAKKSLTSSGEHDPIIAKPGVINVTQSVEMEDMYVPGRQQSRQLYARERDFYRV